MCSSESKFTLQLLTGAEPSSQPNARLGLLATHGNCVGCKPAVRAKWCQATAMPF